jgi:hypothetical protein
MSGLTRYWTTCEDGIPGLDPAPKGKGNWVKYAEATERITELEECIRELLKGGEHEGECDNDQGMINEGGACQKHCVASEQREADAKKLLEEKA